jgi:signal transduction histidine kinase
VRVAASLALAALAGVVATAVLAVVRLIPGSATAAAAPTLDDAIPLLLAIGAMCVVGLTIRRRPTAAWLATIAALTIVTVDLAAAARILRDAAEATAGAWLTVAICLAALASVGAAAAYAAAAERRLGGWVTVVAVGAVGLCGAACLLVLADPDGVLVARLIDVRTTPLGAVSLVTRTFLIAVAGLVAIGLLGDARPAARRASRRIAATEAAPTSPRARVALTRAWLRAFGDEVAPGRSRAHAAVVSERSRLARDLHAQVVPAVRRALTEAERDGSPEHLAASLRAVLVEVDELVQTEHAIQLEVGGLVPALEWLAERTEDRSTVRVTIDLVDAPGEPPIEVAAAAFRVAQLALENVVRHAPGAGASVAVTTRTDHLRLVIADDGPGIADGAGRAAVAAGRRGLADMDAEAARCGAGLVVGRAPTGAGTVVTFDWPAA